MPLWHGRILVPTRRSFLLTAAAMALAGAAIPLPARSAELVDGQAAATIWIKRHAQANWTACHRLPAGPLYAVVRCYGSL